MMRCWLMRALSTYLLLAALGCRLQAATELAGYAVSGNAEGAPAGCSAEDVAARLAGLFDAISRGDAGVVDEYFGRASGAAFQWYSIGLSENDSFAAYNWGDLEAYFEQRYRQNERLQLLSVEITGWDAGRGLVHFGPISLTRQADDLGWRAQPLGGKGAYHCGRQAFVVLSIGAPVE